MIIVKKFNPEDYESVRRYILSTAISPDGTKCGLLVYNEISIDLCLNDQYNIIAICDIGKKNVSDTNYTSMLDTNIPDTNILEEGNKIFETILKLSRKQYMIDYHYIEFYNNHIAPTPCCYQCKNCFLKNPEEKYYYIIF